MHHMTLARAALQPMYLPPIPLSKRCHTELEKTQFTMENINKIDHNALASTIKSTKTEDDVSIAFYTAEPVQKHLSSIN